MYKIKKERVETVGGNYASFSQKKMADNFFEITTVLAPNQTTDYINTPFLLCYCCMVTLRDLFLTQWCLHMLSELLQIRVTNLMVACEVCYTSYCQVMLLRGGKSIKIFFSCIS